MHRFRRHCFFLALLLSAAACTLPSVSNANVLLNKEPVYATTLKPVFQPDNLIFLTHEQKFPRLGRGFSGVTFIPDTGRYLIVDDACRILELTVTGKGLFITRVIELDGFSGCEDIAYVYSGEREGTYAVAVLEKYGSMLLFEIDPQVMRVKAASAQRFDIVPPHLFGRRHDNRLEGITVDVDEFGQLIFYIARKKKPRRIERAVLEGSALWKSIPWNAETLLPHRTAISALCFDHNSLFVLDEKTKSVWQADPVNGNLVAGYRLPNGKGRYQGLAFAHAKGGMHEMVLVAEKNTVLVFRWDENLAL